MDDNYTYIKKYVEEYYREMLDTAEKKQFEENIIGDPVFADEVAFYLSTISATKEIRQEETRARFKELYKQKVAAKERRPSGVISLSRVIISVAACLLMATGIYYFFGRSTDPQQLAENYIKANIQTISSEMGPANNLQNGIAAYNNKEYTTALELFKQAGKDDPSGSLPLQYIGQTYLMKGVYDSALYFFSALDSMKDLVSNPGKFLKAVTFMKRNQDADKDSAKILLQQVMKENAEGSNEAKQWNNKF
jgi:hypothetical protein